MKIDINELLERAAEDKYRDKLFSERKLVKPDNFCKLNGLKIGDSVFNCSLEDNEAEFETSVSEWRVVEIDKDDVPIVISIPINENSVPSYAADWMFRTKEEAIVDAAIHEIEYSEPLVSKAKAALKKFKGKK